jgi:hypothetical protein
MTRGAVDNLEGTFFRRALLRAFGETRKEENNGSELELADRSGLRFVVDWKRVWKTVIRLVKLAAWDPVVPRKRAVMVVVHDIDGGRNHVAILASIPQ